MLFLYILLAVILLILLLLIIPLGFDFNFSTNDFSIKLKYLFLSFKVSADTVSDVLDLKTGKPRKEKKQKKKADSKKESKLLQGADTASIVFDLLYSAKKPWSTLRKHVFFKNVNVYMLVSARDAHKTAVLYSSIYSAVFAFINVIAESFAIGSHVIYIQPDFSSDKIRYDISANIRIRPLFLVISGILLLIDYMKRQSEHKRENIKEGKKHEPKTSRK